MKKIIVIVVLAFAVLLMGCGKKKEETEKYYKYYALNVSDEDELREVYFPLYENEYIKEFGVNGYDIEYEFDSVAHRAKWRPIKHVDPWWDDVETGK